jgi:glycine/D-amino acid oxidase-like deaminating enzyme
VALREQGADVAVLEAAKVGNGASGRNGGQLIPGLKLDPDGLIKRYGTERGDRMVEFAGASATRTAELIERLGIECGLALGGWFQAARSPAQTRRIATRVEEWNRYARLNAGLEVSAATKAVTGTDWYRNGWFDPRAGTLQPLDFARGLARAAMARGARLFEDSPVTEIHRVGEGWRLVTPQGSLVAPMLLVATNAYTATLWPDVGRSLLPVTSLQIATAPLPADTLSRVMNGCSAISDTCRIIHYMRLDASGTRVVFGGRGSFSHHNAASWFGYLEHEAVALFPALREVAWTHRWGGTVAMTVDGLPRLLRLGDGAYAAVGYNGRGVAMATQLGRLAAELLGGAAAETLPFPVTDPDPIPASLLRRPALEAAGLWFRLLDRLGR